MPKKGKLMDKVLFVALGILILFAWFDSQHLIGIKMIDRDWQDPANNVWSVFAEQISPAAFNMWIGVLLALGLIWYLFSKDKSEALAIFLTPAILIIFGVQDVIYYIFSPDVMSQTMGCWADALSPVKIISDLLGETCPTMISFMLSVVIGIFLAIFTYKQLKKARW